MDKIAIISDVHGNIPALERVLADINRRGIEQVFCLGDIVGKGPQPAQAIDLIRELCVACVVGNWEVGILDPNRHDQECWHVQRIGPERMRYLRGLGYHQEFWLSGRRVRLFHASSRGVFHRVRLDASDAERMEMFRNPLGRATMFEADADIIGYGDIHTSYVAHFASKVLFNAGSVGNPLDMTLASYVILEGNYQSSTPASFSLQTVRVPYDIEEAIQIAIKAEMPNLTEYVQELRTGRYRGMQA